MSTPSKGPSRITSTGETTSAKPRPVTRWATAPTKTAARTRADTMTSSVDPPPDRPVGLDR
ncbi:hypothetical protein BC477_19190 [Clavibacter michiganensis subsp. michiganensis]|uniref:Uncharacterized protein n=1 Tax=Clavibacter michiganensis subsp. michiganensis TaxID=33013 RepID=A0A251XGU1_CLAMM|nr:hypothetical protein BC477_19190 [Clavibacter michiganensis subsp. michiganensis]OUE01610.1 hypothetical protein CMMCAS07_14975 [Clavibacter michiganensis subsp. michiganensis]